ncbi:Clp protease N-terminal domain-containing protein [Streptomyces cyaneofuscatus]|uniref:Clp protease N-terminal domain-containing protein n=1 Tax=Streptomyces cyaneofuscatus TaxID=66883 RepID=UPI0036806221
MRHVYVLARWCPLAGIVAWLGLGPSGLPWYELVCVVVMAALPLILIPLSLGVGALGWWLFDLPLGAGAATLAYPVVVLPVLSWSVRRFRIAPPRPARLTPRLRCGHGQDDREAVRRAEQDMREGRWAAALDGWLRLLDGHRRVADPQPCGRVLLLRAAEAALLCGCHLLAAELAEAAVPESEGQPLGRAAIVAVRARALRAAALLALGDEEESGRELRAAQWAAYQDRSTHELVRLTAVAAHHAARRPHPTYDEELTVLGQLLVDQSLDVGNPRVLFSVNMAAGRRLFREGYPAEAAEAFRGAGRATRVPDHLAVMGPAVLARWQNGVERRWLGAVRLWLTAFGEEMRCHVELAEPLDREDALVLDRAVGIAAQFDDPLLTAWLTACRDRLKPRGEEAGDAVGAATAPAPGIIETRPFVFADPGALEEWLRLRRFTEARRHLAAPPDGDGTDPLWSAGRGRPEQLLASSSEAEDFFVHFRLSAPRPFAPVYRRVTAAADELAVRHGRRVPVRTAEQALAVLEQASVRGLAAALAQGTARTLPAAARTNTAERVPALASAPAPAGGRAAGTTSSASVPRRAPETASPPWLETADRLLACRSWTVVAAAFEAQRLGLDRIGAEQLLHAALGDPTCAELAAPLGLDRETVGRQAGALLASGGSGDRELALSPRAATVLVLAREEADQWESGQVLAVHLLAALLRQRDGTVAVLLAEQHTEVAELLARVERELEAAQWPSATPRWVAGLPSPRHYTPGARRVLASAAVFASASDNGSAGLLGPAELAAALRERGRSPAHPGTEGSGRVTLTHRGRQVLARATSQARLLGHPGVDLGHLENALAPFLAGTALPEEPEPAALPLPWAASVTGVLMRASELAGSRGCPFVGPEHLLTALGSEAPPPAPGTPLPLTPLSERALEQARSIALGKRLAHCDDACLREGLAAVWQPLPPADAHGTPPDSGPGEHPWPLLLLDPDARLADLDARDYTAALKRDEAELRAVRTQRADLLRVLAETAPDEYENRLVDALLAALHPGIAAARTLDEAAARARRAAARADGPASRLVLAQKLFAIGTRARALQGARPALVHFDAAAEALNGAVNGPGDALPDADVEQAESLLADVLLKRAEILAGAGSPAAAAAFAEAAGCGLASLAEDDGAPRGGRVETVLEAVDGLAGLGEHREALRQMNRAIRLASLPPGRLADFHEARARLLWRLEAEDLGRADWEAALALEPGSPYRHLCVGVHLMSVEEAEAAVSVFRRANTLAPEYAAARRRLGQALVRAGHFAEALPVLNEALAELPPSQLVRHSPTYLARAQALRASGRTEEALRDARTAASLDPEAPWYHYQRGLSLLDDGPGRRGRPHIVRAFRLETESLQPDGLVRAQQEGNLVVYCAALGDRRQAEERLAEALRAMRLPWLVRAFRTDLDELARTVPSRAELCRTLLRTAREPG